MRDVTSDEKDRRNPVMRAAKFFGLELETGEKQKSDTRSQSEWGHAETRVTQGHRVSGATQRLG